MSYLVSDLIQASLRLIDRLKVGRTASASELAAGLECLNTLIDSWNADRLFIFEIAQAVFTLVPNQQSYTIGPSGANFTATRPERIERANIVDVTSNPSVPSRYPLDLLDSRGWSEIRVLSISSPLPDNLYFDRAWPNSTLYLYPSPSAANQLELYTWQQMAAFATTAAAFSVPPGYWEALRYNLAVRMVPEVLDAKLSEEVAAIAAQSLARIQGMNAPSPVLRADEGMPRPARPSFNYLIGS